MKRFVNFKREVDSETRNKPCWIVFIAIDGACGYRKEVKALRYDALPYDNQLVKGVGAIANDFWNTSMVVTVGGVQTDTPTGL